MDLQKEWYQNELVTHEFTSDHRPMEEEYSFYQAVKAGNVPFVMNNLDQNVFANTTGMGTLSKNSLMNMKYHFVITVAMITRYCTEGGMELEQAYGLSDFYILKMDSCIAIEEIIELHKTMTLDFTHKMQLLQKHAALSKSITLCLDYIYHHINERILIQDLAEYTHLSTSYLSKLFKKELGISVSDYIRKKKIETAQNLLRYSTYSFIDITNYLEFSSQSHFIQAFEKQVGITPKKYRDKYYRTKW